MQTILFFVAKIFSLRSFNFFIRLLFAPFFSKLSRSIRSFYSLTGDRTADTSDSQSCAFENSSSVICGADVQRDAQISLLIVTNGGFSIFRSIPAVFDSDCSRGIERMIGSKRRMEGDVQSWISSGRIEKSRFFMEGKAKKRRKRVMRKCLAMDYGFERQSRYCTSNPSLSTNRIENWIWYSMPDLQCWRV